jgi:outer membrane protein OmpA-like peptidoglycan-associated protein
MRATFLTVVGLSVGLTIAPQILGGAAYADPAYQADAVTNFFLKAKNSGNNGPTKSICFGTAADCPAPPSVAAAKFDLLVNFEFNSNKLTQAARQNLDQFAKALLDPRLKDQSFEIDGHTDATGAEQYNLGLSERRAAAVVAYLASQGLDAAHLKARGFGKTRPLVADPYSPQNRRVDTHLLEQ